MGFQTGSQIRPELGALDYSGYTNAANIQAQAMANAGQQIGGAIQNYFQKKEEKKQQELTYNTLLPYVQENLGAGKDAENIAKMFSKDPAMAQQALQLGMQSREQKAQQNALAAATTVTKEGNKIDTQAAIPAYLELGGSDPAGFGQLLKQFTGNGDIEITPEGLAVQDGRVVANVGRPQSEKDRVPTQIQVQERRGELFNKGLEAFKSGNTDEALKITRMLGEQSPMGGYLTIDDLESFYGSTEPTEELTDKEDKPDSLGLGL